MIETISLDENWRAMVEDDSGAETAGSDIPSLARCDLRFDAGSWRLTHQFDLPVQDVCITYLLEIETLPPHTRLSINKHDFGEISAPFSQDVTEFVWLDKNLITLRVSTAGAFGFVRLIAIPCD